MMVMTMMAVYDMRRHGKKRKKQDVKRRKST